MSQTQKDYSLHLVGLGGAGVSIVDTFLSNDSITDFLSKRGVKLSVLALDIADHDIMRLQKTHESLSEKLQSKSIPSEKLQFNARSVKFPTPEAMFDFIEKLPQYLKTEGSKRPANYKPWVSSSTEIPPLAGGVGRRRALSKAIYGLNYYHLRLIDIYTESFKDSVASSTLQPIIITIFGVGGGSGSGMVVDFARHLRMKLGSGFPIIGLGVLPCAGDDQRAKGPSALSALNELGLLLDAKVNKNICDKYGAAYQNPFTSLMLMPLSPPFRRSGNLIEAQKLFDDAVVDILMNSFKFDISDMLDNATTTSDYAGQWVNLLTTLRVTYPINEQIKLAKLYLEKANSLRDLRQTKMELLNGSIEKKSGGLVNLIDSCYDDLVGLYRNYLKDRELYDESKFEDDLHTYMYGDNLVDLNIKMQVTGCESLVKEQVKEVTTPVSSIGVDSPEGSAEALFVKYIAQIVDLSSNLSQNYQTFHDEIWKLVDDMNANVAGMQSFTFRERIAFNDLIELMRLIDSYLSLLTKYTITTTLAEKLQVDLSKHEKNDFIEKSSEKIQRIVDLELKLMFEFLTSIFVNSKNEISSVDILLTETRKLRQLLSDELNTLISKQNTLQSNSDDLQLDQKKAKRTSGKLLLKVFNPGKRKRLSAQVSDLSAKIDSLKLIIDELNEEKQLIESRSQDYSHLIKLVETTSDYRKLLRNMIDLDSQYYSTLNETTEDRGYYDRVAEITEPEKLRIMQKILGEEEEQLSRENILKDIIDKQRFREYLVGVIRSFQIPSTIAVTSKYKTDYIWVTISTPKGVWDQDMDAEIKAALSGYTSGDASKCITLTHIESDDAWTIRFLVLAARAKHEDLDMLTEMNNLYEQSSESDRLLSHSFLLEHGVVATRDKKDLASGDSDSPSKDKENGLEESKKKEKKKVKKRKL